MPVYFLGDTAQGTRLFREFRRYQGVAGWSKLRIAVNGAIGKTGKRRRSAIDRRTTRHSGYAVSQRIRKRIEEAFGWIKAQAG